jgi:hypothetical protein
MGNRQIVTRALPHSPPTRGPKRRHRNPAFRLLSRPHRVAGKESVASRQDLFYIMEEFRFEEVILVNRPLFFAPSKS